jgi:hypothetical protein
MTRTVRSLVLLGLLGLASPMPAFAQVNAAPTLLNYQGRLANPDGFPVPDGTYSIRFSLWDAATAGTEKWNQTIANVSVKNGTFAVLLNTNTTGLFDNNLWLETKIGTDAALTPRQQLVSVAYAMKANSVPDGSIGANQIANNSITANKFANDALGWLLSGNNITNPATQFLGTTSNQPLAFKTNNTEQMRLLANGRLGLGTATPTARLEILAASVADGLRLTGSSGNAPMIGLFEGGNERGAIGLALSGGQYSTSAVSGDITLRANSGRLHLQNGGGAAAMTVVGNRIGVGTVAPSAPLSVAGAGRVFETTDGTRSFIHWLGDLGGGVNGAFIGTLSNHPLFFQAGNAASASLYPNGNFGVGTLTPTAMLHVNGSAKINGTSVIEFGAGITKEQSAGKIGYQTFTADALDIVGAGTTVAARKIKFWNEGGATFAGRITVPVVAITGGSDVAEPYNVSPAGEIKPVPGMVVCIDGAKVGQMKVAGKAYDKTVAGILSGANGVNPGITLTQKGTVADGELPVASIGRVWCWCDADANGAIEAGDMLTTSDTPGHAMKVDDHTKANGAVIGKAMSSLKSGKGLVLVLVSLK